MRVVVFSQSLISDWGNPGAHFLRGVASELISRGHDVRVLEPKDGYSLSRLVAQEGEWIVERFRRVFRHLVCELYDLASLDLDAVLDGADLCIVHEGSAPELVRRVGAARARRDHMALFLHDRDHRSVSDPPAIAGLDLSRYDGILAAGTAVRNLYLSRRWCKRAWTWREAADTRLFGPQPPPEDREDVVWIGNAGDEERHAALRKMLLGPCRALGLKGSVYGVGYTPAVIEELARSGLRYAGWIPNWEVPRALAHARLTVHLPRRPQVKDLPGMPTTRVYEALACAMPLVSGEWPDDERLFDAGSDYLVARDADEMERHMETLLREPAMAKGFGTRGRQRVLERHTCAHRVDELFDIVQKLGAEGAG